VGISERQLALMSGHRVILNAVKKARNYPGNHINP
jgi:hypothetical protein